MAGYADRAKAEREERNFKFPGGEYDVRFKGYKRGKTQIKRTDEIALEFKVLKAPDEETMDKIRRKGRNIKVGFYPATPWSFGSFLIFLEDMGADLSKCRSQEEDPDFSDLLAILDAAEKTPPDCTVKLTPDAEVPSRYNIRFTDVEKIFGNAAKSATPPPAPNAPAWIQGASGTVEAIDKGQLQAHISAGYTGLVCVDGANWVKPETLGYAPAALTAPAGAPPAAQAAPAPAPQPAPTPAAPVPPSAPAAPAAPALPAMPSMPPLGQFPVY